MSKNSITLAPALWLATVLGCSAVTNYFIHMGSNSSFSQEKSLRSFRWSEIKRSKCAAGSHCTVPAGETWQVDSNMDVETLTVEGTLQWDTSKDGLELRTGFLFIKDGALEIGTEAAPMEKKATIYIKRAQHQAGHLGSRGVGGMGSMTIIGRKLERTWTLLAETATTGATKIRLKHDPAAMGWQEGDRIGIATTIRPNPQYIGESSTATIDKLEGTWLHLRESLPREHWGGFKGITNPSGEVLQFEMAAEVVNLERSILITGDTADFDSDHLGLHVMMARGKMDVRYTRVEKCGQQDIMGRYCLHFHRMKRCPECAFIGNAVVDSWQGGITIHGTHGALVDQNTLWDTRAFGIYTEDGNEMDNTISKNVVICSERDKCSTKWVGGGEQWAGIYMIGMTNNVLENRIIGHEHCIWTAASIATWGKGAAVNKVCTQHAPFLTFKGNVCHDCRRFGIYLDNQYPRNLVRDDDGMVTSGCDEFNADGTDNGVLPANVIEDQFDWHNMFVGQYSMGDIAYVRLTSINNDHVMYWKTTKNFADGVSYHISDSIIAVDHTIEKSYFPPMFFLGPGGPFAFKMRNVKFIGGPAYGGALQAGQHCGLGGAGGPCNTQYLLEDVDFSGLTSGSKKIKFGANSVPAGYVLPVFLSKDNSLGGYRSIVSKHLNGFASLPECQALGKEWDDGIGCHADIRRLNIWTSQEEDDVTLSGPGYDVAPNNADPVLGLNSGVLAYDDAHAGYGGLVMLGKQYTLGTSKWQGNEVFRFSDKEVAEFYGAADETLSLTIGTTECQLKASDDRRFVGAKGIHSSAAQGACGPAVGGSASGLFPGPEPGPTPAPPETPEPEPSPPQSGGGSCDFADSPAIGYFWDPSCLPSGGVGCYADGKHTECRFCGEAPMVPCPTETPEPGPTPAPLETPEPEPSPPQSGGGSCDFDNPPAIGYFWDPRCLPSGGVGCYADGKHTECRFCGEAPMVPCPAEMPEPGPSPPSPAKPEPEPSPQPQPQPQPPPPSGGGSCNFDNPPAIGYFWDPNCLPSGGVGCYADGKHTECRFCGEAPMVPCPGDDQDIPAEPMTCREVRDVIAEDHSCGSRIDWLMDNNEGMTRVEAGAKIAGEFPGECGPCGGCAAAKDVMAGEHPCGGRMSWLQSNAGMTEEEAGDKVASEFPEQCGACGDMLMAMNSKGGSHQTVLAAISQDGRLEISAPSVVEQKHLKSKATLHIHPASKRMMRTVRNWG